jgi:hypothetical protein
MEEASFHQEYRELPGTRDLKNIKYTEAMLQRLLLRLFISHPDDLNY